MLLEHDGLDVGQVHHHVDDGELEVRIFLGDLFDRGGLGEARGDDGLVALVGEVADGLLALGLVGDFELAIGDPGLGLELLRAVEHAFVERLVELAADVEDDGRLVLGQCGRAGDGKGRSGGQKCTSEHVRLPVVVFCRSNHNPAGVAIPISSVDQITAPAPWSSGRLESRGEVSHMMDVAEDAGSGSRRLLLHEGKTE